MNNNFSEIKKKESCNLEINNFYYLLSTNVIFYANMKEIDEYLSPKLVI